MVVCLLRWAALALLVVPLGACLGQEEVSGQALCEDSAQAVSQQTLSCGGDVELANDRYDRVLSSAPCIAKVQAGADPDGSCAAAIRRLTCEQAEKLGDDARGWLERAECATTFDLGDASFPEGGAP